MYELKIKTHFSAAHQLTMVSEKCENLHGHNWKIEVYVTGESLDKAGVLVDFGQLKSKLAEVIKKLDHQFLNELSPFAHECPPSSENIAKYIADELQVSISGISDSRARVSRVSAWESDNACATYVTQ